MTVPTLVRFDSLSAGDVLTVDNTAFFEKCDATTWVNLATGIINASVDPGHGVIFLPGAKLVLG